MKLEFITIATWHFEVATRARLTFIATVKIIENKLNWPLKKLFPPSAIKTVWCWWHFMTCSNHGYNVNNANRSKYGLEQAFIKIYSTKTKMTLNKIKLNAIGYSVGKDSNRNFIWWYAVIFEDTSATKFVYIDGILGIHKIFIAKNIVLINWTCRGTINAKEFRNFQ